MIDRRLMPLVVLGILLGYLMCQICIITNATQEYNLIELQQIDTGGLATESEVIESVAYVTDSQNGLVIVDVSKASNPQTKATLAEGIGSLEDIWVSNDLLYIAAGIAGLKILNISDIANPALIGSFSDGRYAHGVPVVERENPLAFIADGDHGLEVMDVSIPENPIKIGQYDSPQYTSIFSQEIALGKGYACLTNRIITEGIIESSDLTILNVSDPSTISSIQTFMPGNDNMFIYAYVSGDLGFFAIHGQNMRINFIDFTQLSSPTLVGW